MPNFSYYIFNLYRVCNIVSKRESVHDLNKMHIVCGHRIDHTFVEAYVMHRRPAQSGYDSALWEYNHHSQQQCIHISSGLL